MDMIFTFEMIHVQVRLNIVEQSHCMAIRDVLLASICINLFENIFRDMLVATCLFFRYLNNLSISKISVDFSSLFH